MLHLLLSILVSAAIDSTTLKLGDQTAMHLEATMAIDDRVTMPVYGEYLIPGIEIVSRSGVDSTTLPDGRLRLRQDLVLTSFEDSLFSIAPIAFVAGNDTLYSDPLMLNVVQPFVLDTTYAITDIKPIEKAPVWLWGILRWVVLALFLCALGGLVLYIVRRLNDHKSLQTFFVPKVPERPAEEVALEKLDNIRSEKIWQSGREKDYHTQLTDVVREYIARRFGVQSVEQTSDETLRAIKPLLNDRRELYQGLNDMLRLADLVKFAKWKATPDENEKSLQTAYRFVQDTTPVNQPAEKEEEAV